MVQQTAAALLDEFIHVQRLFWLPIKLRGLMRRIALDELLGAGIGRGNLLLRALQGVEGVRWGSVDPLGTTVPNLVRFGTPVFVGGDAVSWRPSAPCGGALDIVGALKRHRDQHDGRGYRLHGSMSAKGRREPDNGYGLRMDSWNGVVVDQMRPGGPGRWESVAMARFREYLDREDGISVRGRWGQARGPRRSQEEVGSVQLGSGRQAPRRDIRRNTLVERNGLADHGRWNEAEHANGDVTVAQQGLGRRVAIVRGRGGNTMDSRGRGRGIVASSDRGSCTVASQGRGRGIANTRGRCGGTVASLGRGRGASVRNLPGGEAYHGQSSSPRPRNGAQSGGLGRGLCAVRPA